MAWDGPKSRLGEANFRDDEEMRPTLHRGGVDLDMSCPHCSAFSPVTIEWGEVIALAQGACPPGFVRTTTGHEFSLVCPRCVSHYSGQPGKPIKEAPGMSGEQIQEVRMRRRSISMTRPIGMETVARWLAAARAHGFVR